MPKFYVAFGFLALAFLIGTIATRISGKWWVGALAGPLAFLAFDVFFGHLCFD